jgi:hypothetical protein
MEDRPTRIHHPGPDPFAITAKVFEVSPARHERIRHEGVSDVHQQERIEQRVEVRVEVRKKVDREREFGRSHSSVGTTWPPALGAAGPSGTRGLPPGTTRGRGRLPRQCPWNRLIRDHAAINTNPATDTRASLVGDLHLPNRVLQRRDDPALMGLSPFSLLERDPVGSNVERQAKTLGIGIDRIASDFTSYVDRDRARRTETTARHADKRPKVEPESRQPFELWKPEGAHGPGPKLDQLPGGVENEANGVEYPMRAMQDEQQ